jgi:ATP-dependent DNA helicase DinG
VHAADYLGINGPLSKLLDGFQVRDSQLELCEAIESALTDNSVLVAEAGTGIGKTFAYLVPAIHAGKKVIISTGTRHLQDQLFHTDLPRVVKALDMPVKTALLKGRSNYLCLHRLELAPHLGFLNRETQAILHEVKRWSGSTQSGDIAELPAIAEDSPLWPMVVSSADNCLGGECSYWNDCYVVKARKQAQDADVLVVNHHLLLADMTLKEEGCAELLPGAKAFIIDEAHQLHDVASRFFGESISSRQLMALVKDSIAEQVNDAPDMGQLRDYADALETAAQDMRLALGDSGARMAWRQFQHKPAVKTALDNLIAALQALATVLEVASERSRGLDQCYQRSLKLIACAQRFDTATKASAQATHETESAFILWFETYPKSFMLHATPIDVAGLFRKHTDDFAASWIFTSATLQVNKNFAHFADSLGLLEHRSDVWQSPFDYAKQSLLYLPQGLPEPADMNYTRALIDKIMPVLRASEGRAFLLFTSYRALHEAAEMLRIATEFQLFIQGDTPKHVLLDKFRVARRALLLGTSSFWEGVDVRGEALSCVIIDKLPFASPGDPVMQARIDAIRHRGGQPFMEYQIPQAVIALKQGVGRLIRDVQDHGVVVIGDPRLKQKAYGKIFLNSLPPMPLTQQLSDVQTFFAHRASEDKRETARA